MSRDKRKGWLRDLTVGSEVWAPSAGGDVVRVTVRAVSPTGIITAGGHEFDLDGTHRPARGYSSRGSLRSDAEQAEAEAFGAERDARYAAVRRLEASARNARLRTIAAAQAVLDNPQIVEAVEALLSGVTP